METGLNIEGDAQPPLHTNPHLQRTAGPGERCVSPGPLSSSRTAIQFGRQGGVTHQFGESPKCGLSPGRAAPPRQL